MKLDSRTLRYLLPVAMLAVFMTCGLSTAMAEEGEGDGDDEGGVSASVTSEAEADPEPEGKKAPYRGSMIVYRNNMNALTLKKDAEPDYNPMYAMALSFAPRWWFNDMFYASLGLGLSWELTESNWTTKENETVVSDLSLGFGAANFYKIPVLEIGISAGLTVAAPTSKMSQAATMVLALKPSLSLSRSFDLLAGLNLGYTLAYSQFFHEYTTAQLEGVRVTGLDTNTPVRNTQWRVANVFNVSLAFVQWLSLSMSFGVVNSGIYKQDDVATHSDGFTGGEFGVGDSVRDDVAEDIRYSLMYSAELGINPMPALGFGLGFETGNPQLGPDGSYMSPFFNRYTAIYLDMRLNVAGLVSQLKKSEE